MAIGTTNYPTSLDTVVELVEAANGAFDTLSEGINSSVTSLTVNDASKFANSGIVLIDSEYIAYGSKTSTALQSLTRGFEGSSAASHSSGATVRQVITAASNNVKSAAIIALETKLGTGTDIAWGQMAPLTASRLAVTDGSGDVAASGITHDATNLILGNVGAINFDDSPTPTAGDASLARLTWNDSEGTLNLTLKGSNVTVPLSQRDTVRVVNTTASTMAGSDYQVVRITTPVGQRVGVTLAQADTEANSTDIIGVISETIASNGTGFVTTRGIIAGINTTGSLQSETWNEGDVLYLSPTVAGGLTKVKPVAPDNLCIIGYVVYKHATQGKIFVAIQTGWEIDELHNVKITGSPTAGSLLIYNDTLDIWENARITAGTNVTVTNADKSITIAAAGNVTGPASSTSTAIARFTDTSGKAIQNSLITINGSGNMTFPTNIRQTFNPGSTIPGLNVGSVSGDPSSLSNGDIWYNSATSGTGNRQFRVRRNGATETLAVVPPVSTANREIPTINPSTGNLDNVSEMFYISDDNALKVGDVGTGKIQLSAVTTETPSISAIGADSNINLNLVSKGTGTVQANGVAVATISGSQTLTNKTINGSNNTITNVSLSTGVTGTLPIANGGTGATTQQAAMNALAGSTLSGYYLRGNGSNVVMAQVQAGDITGTLAVANGGTGQTSYTDGQLLIGNTATGGLSKATLTAGSNISITNGNGSISIASTAAGVTDGDKGDITVSASGATWTIDNDAVTYAKIQNVTDARLLGRSAGTNGDVQEITVGTGLSLSAGSLTATGGGREVLTAARTYYIGYDLGAVTANATTDKIEKTAHGLENGDPVVFNAATAPSGITIGTIYYVINKSTNDFEISTTVGGSKVTWTTNGTTVTCYTGNDNNIGYGTNGRTVALLTVQKFFDKVKQLDKNDYPVTGLLSKGVFLSSTQINIFTGVGAGRVILDGDSNTTSIIRGTTQRCMLQLDAQPEFELRKVRLDNLTGGTVSNSTLFEVVNGGVCYINGPNFSTYAGTNYRNHIWLRGGTMIPLGNWTISGGNGGGSGLANHIICTAGFFSGFGLSSPITVTISDSPVFSQAFVFAIKTGVIEMNTTDATNKITFSGSLGGGLKAAASLNAVIDASDINNLPGTGTATNTGGVLN
jgi:hypothetical protein